MNTTTKTRSDIHRVSQIVPEDYRYLFSFSYAGNDSPAWNVALMIATRTGETQSEATYSIGTWGDLRVSGRRPVAPYGGEGVAYLFFEKANDASGCDICGAYFRHGDVWQHKATGECIRIGHICADKYSLLTDRSEFHAHKREQVKITAAIRLRRERREELRDWAKANADLLPALKTDHPIARDMRARVIRSPAYGLSVKQVALLKKLAADADKPAEKHVAVPVSDKRQQVEGTVISAKIQDGPYGSTLKITVKVETPEGSYLVWGTCPNVLEYEAQNLGGLKGARVRFMAKVTRSDRDEHFGFFKRPTQPELIGLGDEAREVLKRDTEDLADADSARPEYIETVRARVEKIRNLLGDS